MADLLLVHLTDEAPFALGSITVTPSARTLAAGSYIAVIEPRMMQVLVMLARRRGEVVGRERLIDACWSGRIVGEDAVNRSILKLRRALADAGFAGGIETVAKVGYRLIDPTVIQSAGAAAAPAWRYRARVAIASVAAAAAVALALLLFAHRPTGERRLVVVRPLHTASSDAIARQVSQDLTSDLSRAVLGHDGELDFASASDAPQRGAAFTVSGSVETAGGDLHAVVAVKQGDDPAILWSHDYTARLTDRSSLRQQISTSLAAVLVCAIGTQGIPDGMKARAVAMYLESCNLRSGDQRQEAYLLRQVTTLAPEFAGGWANLAVSLAFASDDATSAEAAAMRRDSAMASNRALSLDAHQGNAYYARALLLPGIGNWITRAHILHAGLRADPDNPQLFNRLAVDLAAIGRNQDSVAANRRAVALDPLFPGKSENLAYALAAAGDQEEAEGIVRHMREVWPADEFTWQAAFNIAARYGDPHEAEALLSQAPDDEFSPAELKAWTIFLNVRSAPARQNVDDAISALLKLRDQGAASDAQLVNDFTLLGRPNLALAVAMRMPPQPDDAFWFRPFLQPLRADPRFMTIARIQGLLQIWRVTGLWPDFCSDRSLTYKCNTFR